jgi:hypothetical protein
MAGSYLSGVLQDFTPDLTYKYQTRQEILAISMVSGIEGKGWSLPEWSPPEWCPNEWSSTFIHIYIKIYFYFIYKLERVIKSISCKIYFSQYFTSL